LKCEIFQSKDKTFLDSITVWAIGGFTQRRRRPKVTLFLVPGYAFPSSHAEFLAFSYSHCPPWLRCSVRTFDVVARVIHIHAHIVPYTAITGMKQANCVFEDTKQPKREAFTPRPYTNRLNLVNNYLIPKPFILKAFTYTMKKTLKKSLQY
jgi:hypothetical protein